MPAGGFEPPKPEGSGFTDRCRSPTLQHRRVTCFYHNMFQFEHDNLDKAFSNLITCDCADYRQCGLAAMVLVCRSIQYFHSTRNDIPLCLRKSRRNAQ